MSEHPEHPLSFEEALRELEAIVQSLESAHVAHIGLEEAIRRYERGMALIRYCLRQLDEATLRVRQIASDFQDEAST
ncbi:MAG: exodeoxyribonuclease VII small subunit [Bacteroidetes bacterium]|nr:exodeoxyribonuclease VII small subunit [Rhodothermia bacterium]MCS7154720.1 exodeoxyribonuclease VII small subunit [Bacteroidota bacterium]MCX7907123.1 exodeoxyribonuclease VII small subunit [Bacteroidota bacterium]MDW8137513.1 exodeoxyribonuclease VII small subunit [Bacteroidota bacterium]MDW8285533.1 exodeoxyribonuclease VII small subunit [Bacteroidota bacterium]